MFPKVLMRLIRKMENVKIIITNIELKKRYYYDSTGIKAIVKTHNINLYVQ